MPKKKIIKGHAVRCADGGYVWLPASWQCAIHAMCTKCKNWETDPKDCTEYTCPLYPYRGLSNKTFRGVPGETLFDVEWQKLIRCKLDALKYIECAQHTDVDHIYTSIGKVSDWEKRWDDACSKSDIQTMIEMSAFINNWFDDMPSYERKIYDGSEVASAYEQQLEIYKVSLSKQELNSKIKPKVFKLEREQEVTLPF